MVEKTEPEENERTYSVWPRIIAMFASFALVAVVFTAVELLNTPPVVPQPELPHIIFILADDLVRLYRYVSDFESGSGFVCSRCPHGRCYDVWCSTDFLYGGNHYYGFFRHCSLETLGDSGVHNDNNIMEDASLS
ncbi:hypothetical protein TNCV_1209951 [Trichonephila clavipes]|nr:hypothetical protein TNCV_1209951 [Trichonephila clavipes]